MSQVPRRTGLSGPTLIRVLARLTDAAAPESKRSLSDQLSQWLGWTEAIALSTALKAPAAETAAGARAPSAQCDAEAAECARVRTALAEAVREDGALAARRRAPARTALPEPGGTVAYAVYRQRYLTLQQTMETGIAGLRGRLRTALAAGAPGMAKLAMVDAVMERVMSAHERSLLAAVPGMLETHFTRLRQGEEVRLAAALAEGRPAPVAAGAWQSAFRRDMQSVLLAELEIRFQPIDGLLAALRAS
ncbi:hypothetical protein BKK81_27410 [Cupriavidus sp. USMAHM13]|uniref:DUF3348 domain-containing protein n=1 Tax=Cupriavidus sp. USMAHM13 TaxID=1389192 RepID=UPI0008A68CA2|nr:DUF3348 domain-containing protein [Cupriavidus sp. USMAHM13]AOZ02897.1 hypothetical protein BKK81_27410 [Cupriavidus sp. USMAHM13]